MNFYIRTNFSKKTGLGHLSRTSRLAKKLIEAGFNCEIYLDKYKKKAIEVNKKIKFFSLYKNKNFFNEKEDAELFLKKTSLKPGTIIVDDYRLGIKWEKKISKFHKKIILIDDLNDKEHYADMIINSNPTFNENLNYNYNLSRKKNCDFLLGSKYSLINKKFRKKKNNKFQVAFYNGGAGNLDFAKNILKNLLNINKKKFLKIKFNIIQGPLSKNNLLLKKLTQKYKNIKIIKNVSNLNNILINSNLLVSSAGMISVEASYCKVPSVLFQVSKNQLVDRSAMEKIGHHLILEKNDLKNISKITYLITLLIDNFKRLKKMKKNLRHVDGQGTNRVLNKILNKNNNLSKNKFKKKPKIKKIALQKREIISVNDLHINEYLKLRNLPLNRKNSFKNKKISYLDHYVWWFKSKRNSFLLKKSNKILMFLYNEKIIYNKQLFLWSGWFGSDKNLNGLDVLWALKWNLDYLSKQYKKYISIVTADKSNTFANRHTKFLGYKLLDKKNPVLKIFFKKKMKISNKFNIYIAEFNK